MKKIFTTLIILLFSTTAIADLATDLNSLEGYTVLGSKTIVGWYDNNEKSDDSFEGCDFDRVIVFNGNKTLTCTSYGYQYSYMPRAIILSNGYSFKMVVNNQIYDMRR